MVNGLTTLVVLQCGGEREILLATLIHLISLVQLTGRHRWPPSATSPPACRSLFKLGPVHE